MIYPVGSPIQRFKNRGQDDKLRHRPGNFCFANPIESFLLSFSRLFSKRVTNMALKGAMALMSFVALSHSLNHFV